MDLGPLPHEKRASAALRWEGRRRRRSRRLIRIPYVYEYLYYYSTYTIGSGVYSIFQNKRTAGSLRENTEIYVF
jgi:hypothetical protein